LTANGKAFGSLGIVLSLVGYLFVMVTLSLVCAVFSPVWFAWREDEKSRSHEETLATDEADPGSPPALDA
jgi:hypothetical protein